MKDTIKAHVGYSIKRFFEKSTIGCHARLLGKVYDGDTFIMTAEYRTMAEYEEEKRNNEWFIQHEVFTTVKGNQFIYWSDTEFDLDYITKIEGQ